MLHQTMSGVAAQWQIEAACQKYAMEIRDERLTLEAAHKLLAEKSMSLFEIAGLAKAIACFQCTKAA